MFLTFTASLDNLCDYTYNFTWQTKKTHPKDVIPFQSWTNYTFKDIVDELRRGRNVRISGNAGKRLGYSMGVDIKHLGGTGQIEKAGNIYIEGNVSSEMGMGMVSGIIYVKGNVEEPLGNVLEVVSDEADFRKFRSITDILRHGIGKDTLVKNNFNEQKRFLLLDDGILRGTIAARCDHDMIVKVKGDVYNGTGLLMQKGMIHVLGDAGMNTGAHLEGGLVLVEGIAGEFAGAYMKKGTIILHDAKGFVGAHIKAGAILSKRKVKVSPPMEELEMEYEDAKVIMKHLGIGHVEAMSYHKYGLIRERLVRMRDGSVVVRKADE